MRIEEDIVQAGYFWLPSNEGKKIPGKLKITDGGHIELEAVGLFDEHEQALSNDTHVVPRIIGLVEGGKFVTLDHCYYKNRSISFGGVSKSELIAGCLLSGVAFEQDEPILFDRFSFSTDCFDEWLGITGFSIKREANNKKYNIDYHAPDTIQHKLNNGMTLSIKFKHSIPINSHVTEVHAVQKAFIELSFEELLPFEEFRSTAFKLVSFLGFAIDKTVTIKDVVAKSSEITQKFNDIEHSTPIPVYYKSNPFVEKVAKQHPVEMLFNFKVIHHNAESVFSNWISAYEQISPAINLYFATITGAQKYLDGRFLALVQGLETYHRRTSSDKLMDTKVFEELVGNLLEHCPSEHRDWLNKQLFHGNEISLNKRLRLITKPFKHYLGSNKEVDKVLRKIVDARNYFTHYDQRLEGETATGVELVYLCDVMELIFQLHLLKVIGFTDDEIKEVITKQTTLRRKINSIKKLQ
ncbi:hypothetical protein CYQ91_19210 [Vibrio diabolicus]|uniref:ApeA N-terminal domain-containing protein n=1 Tax=Vibrio diabolicus TaxID=50719 RepID=A0AAX1XIR6_9VIBR|nr:HEPN domain-containing protein [Vibrio diabolicus]RPB36191.1 hypothetical protein CYQ91_19210 [Vibrio diabolicus]